MWKKKDDEGIKVLLTIIDKQQAMIDKLMDRLMAKDLVELKTYEDTNPPVAVPGNMGGMYPMPGSIFGGGDK